MPVYENKARCRVSIPGIGTIQPGGRITVKGTPSPGVLSLEKAKVLEEVTNVPKASPVVSPVVEAPKKKKAPKKEKAPKAEKEELKAKEPAKEPNPKKKGKKGASE